MKRKQMITIGLIAMWLSIIANWIVLFTIGGGTDAYWGCLVVWGLATGFLIGGLVLKEVQ